MSIASTNTTISRPASLAPVLSGRWALTWQQTLVVATLSSLFLACSFLPLETTQLPSHLSYGQSILSHGRLPAAELTMPLAEGMGSINSSWLAQAALAKIELIAGIEGVSVGCALLMTVALAVLFGVFYRQSRLAVATVMMLVGVATFVIQGSLIGGPGVFGLMSLAALLWILACSLPWRSFTAPPRGNTSEVPRWAWPAMFALFAVWTNLHASFLVGLVILACHVVGRAWQVACRDKSLLAPLRDRAVWTWVLLLEVALLATLINPYGWNLLPEMARTAFGSELFSPLGGALALTSLAGWQFVLSIVLLVVLLRHSRQRVSAVAVVLLLSAACGAIASSMLLPYFAITLAFVLMPHVRDCWLRAFGRQPNAAAVEPTGAWDFRFTMLSVLIVWTAFAFSPLSRPMLGGAARPVAQMLSATTPHSTVDYFRQQPPDTTVWAPSWWGGWLTWAGGNEVSVIATSQVHLLPLSTQRDYLRVAQAHSGWRATLDRLGISTIVVDRRQQPSLAAAARKASSWRLVFEDEQALIFQHHEEEE